MEKRVVSSKVSKVEKLEKVENEVKAGKEYGYARVSTVSQKEDRQIAALLQNGISEECIYVDKVSGTHFKRPAYQKLIKKLCQGDVLFIKSICRLGRDYKQVLDEWRHITKVVKADIVVLDMPLLDTRAKENLIGQLIADIVLTVLSYVAQAERENLRIRQAEGIAIARTKGIIFGRPMIEMPEEAVQYIDLYIAGTVKAVNAAAKLGVSMSTFRRWVKAVKREQSE